MNSRWKQSGMHDAQAYRRLIALVTSKLLDLIKINVKTFTINQLEIAMTAASAMRGLDCVSVVMS
ncbi:MAG: hypothetical protein WCP20_11805 [Desulfuromonadales bacterium]